MFIGIVGSIGVGKTRLTEALAQRLGYRAYFEPVKENPYLDDFYHDMKRWACVMQFFMLTHRFRQHLEIQALRKKDISVVQDQVIYGDVLYATLTHELGFMDDRDFLNYSSHFETLRPLLMLPDVVIHLETTVENALQRIQRRGRSSEQAIDAHYLTSLNRLFTKWTASVEDKTQVLRLDWNTFQPVEDVVKQIERKLEIQLPLPVET